MKTFIAVVAATVVLFALAPRIIRWFAMGFRLRAQGTADRAAESARSTGALHRDLARAFHEGLAPAERAEQVDDRTWRDLDMEDVLARIDRTISAPGQQYLYHLVRRGLLPEPVVSSLQASAAAIAANPDIASRLRSGLQPLTEGRALQLPVLFQRALPARPALWWLFPLLTLSVVGSLVAVSVWPRAVIVLVAVAAANMVVQLLYKPRIREFTVAFTAIPSLLRSARSLGERDLQATLQRADASALATHSTTLHDGARSLTVLGAATRWLRFEPLMASEFSAMLYEYVNPFFLLDVNAFVFGIEAVRTQRALLQSMYESVGFMDSAQSVAAWRASLPQWTTPVIAPHAKAMQVDDVVHPLVEGAVPNTLDVNGASVLVSGSNMSGKTTFLRALGVNAIIAGTIGTACATRWSAPRLLVGASIGREDNVQEGRSYYLAEVESVRRLLRAKASGAQHLFLLDELYRGTNTPERIAAAYATLRYLNGGDDIVLVATHDLETLDLLGDSYLPVHFREEIVDGALHFDFRLRPGPASTRNAIALLQLMEYPPEVVRDALDALERRERELLPAETSR